MSRTSEPSKSANKRVDRMTQRQLIARYIDEHVTADNMQISKGLNMQLNSVTGRLDEMVYLHQTHRICGVNDNNRSIYVKRQDTDQLNTRPKTKTEILQDKLTAVMEGIGLTEQDVNAFYRNWIEAQIKLSADAEQFSNDIIKKMEAIDELKADPERCYEICENADTNVCYDKGCYSGNHKYFKLKSHE